MKLDVTDLRYLSSDEFRVLTAVEMGSKNHEVVPSVLIVQISGLRNGGVNKLLGSLAQRNLVARVQNAKYDGYRLTYGGYDYLAVQALLKRDSIFSFGNQIGVGKEADIYMVADAEGNDMVIKIHRLGRISFRTIKQKRDYLGKRKSASWMYMSRLAAQKESAFMKVLHEHGFPVPRPIDHSRHCVLMEYIDAYPLRQISTIPSPGKLYSNLMDVIVRFAQAGLIHGDFNEFNILIRRETGDPVVIDFPQMVSVSHENAEWYFNRDVECIRTFFRRRFQYESALYPRFKSTLADGTKEGAEEGFRLDVAVAASGFKHQEMKTLHDYMEMVKVEGTRAADEPSGSEEEDEEDEEEEEEGEEEMTEEKDEDECQPGPSNQTTRRSQEASENGEMEQGEEAERAEEEHCQSGPSQRATCEMTRGGEMVQEPALGALQVPTCRLDDDLEPEDGELSPASPRSRPVSRSPPQSRSPSPESLSMMMASLNLSAQRRGIKEVVSSDISRQRARQQRKYHSKRGSARQGRPRGSKAKQDPRVHIDKGDLW